MMSKINVELIKGIALLMATVGIIGMGAAYPKELGSISLAGLTGIIGGYFGNASPGKQQKSDDQSNTE